MMMLQCFQKQYKTYLKIQVENFFFFKHFIHRVNSIQFQGYLW